MSETTILSQLHRTKSAQKENKRDIFLKISRQLIALRAQEKILNMNKTNINNT